MASKGYDYPEQKWGKEIRYFFTNSVSQLLAPMSKGKMEEKLRPWKVLTSVWAVGAPYPPHGHTGRKPALTVGARFFIKIQDFLNCGKTCEHVRQDFPDFILHIFNCASIIHSFQLKIITSTQQRSIYIELILFTLYLLLVYWELIFKV